MVFPQDWIWEVFTMEYECSKLLFLKQDILMKRLVKFEKRVQFLKLPQKDGHNKENLQKALKVCYTKVPL